MFKGKVRIYQNVNGKEETIKKDFDNIDEYYAFESRLTPFFGRLFEPWDTW